jgi:tetratricopeptide (TPR) repeat protein
MKKIYLCFTLLIITTLVHALDSKYAPIVNAALSYLKTHTTLSLLKGHVAVNISSGNKELDKQFAEAIKDAYPNFESKAESVHNEDLYQMRVKVYRENDEVFVRTTVTNFENKNIVERTAGAKTISLAVLETLQYETAIHAKNEFEAYLDSAFADAGEVVMSLRIFIIRGVAFFHDKKYESALAEFNTVLVLKPDDAEALYWIGNVNSLTKKYSAAIEYYTRALNINLVPVVDPSYDDAYFSRGYCYLEIEEYDRAIADFNESEKLRPKSAVMFYSRGYAYLQKDNYTAAIKDFTKSIALKQDNAYSYFFRGLSYFKSLKYEKAIKDYSHGIKINSTEALVYYLRALAYSETSKYAQESKTKSAIADCESALKIKPNDKNAQELLASLRKRQPKPSLIEIDKNGYGYVSAGLVKNMDETNMDESEFKYPNTDDFVSFGDLKYIDESKLYSAAPIGFNILAGGAKGFWGGELGVSCFVNEYKSPRVIFDGTFMASLPIKMSLFTIMPYAGIGVDMVLFTTKRIVIDPSFSAFKSANSTDIKFGVDYELGLKLRIGRIFLSAAYRQRVLPAYKMEYITIDKTDDLLLKRFVISAGIVFF